MVRAHPIKEIGNTDNMGKDIGCLHSHSGLERRLGLPMGIVLVDDKYVQDFIGDGIKTESFRVKNRTYHKVPILAFVKRGGKFMNLNT